MKADSAKWTVNEEAFKSWLGPRESEFEPALDPVPTLKALVFLALLDKRGPCTYEELGKIFESQRVVIGSVPIASLRVALSELGNVLNRSGHRLMVRAFKDGQREVKFELVQRKSTPCVTNKIVIVNEPEGKSSEIAEYMMENQGLPFYALYYLPRSACWWVTFSSREAEERKHYEAEAWYHFGLNQVAAGSASPVVGVVGLATGEGLGEIELLRNVLRDGHTVHYLAVDLSPVLLTAHVEIIREIFEQDLREGKLFCAGALIDVFSDMQVMLTKARSRFVAEGVFSREDEFLPADCPIVATFFGNCLGNYAPDSENVIFSSFTRAFPKNRPLMMLTGVSVVRVEDGRQVPDFYTRSVDEFLLQTPHHLLSNIGVFRSGGEHERVVDGKACPYDEFTLPDESEGDLEEESSKCRVRRSPPVIAKPYAASHGIEGHIYRFYYRLDFDLEMPRKKLQLPAGTEIALYTVIKYDMPSLVEALRKRRFKVLYDKDYHKVIQSNGQRREYAVFAACLDAGAS